MYFLIENLYESSLVSESDRNYVIQNIEVLKKGALDFLKNKNYDFFWGAIGVINYIIKVNISYDISYFTSIFKTFDSLMLNNMKMVQDELLKSKLGGENVVNLGLAHGIASILKMYINCYKKNILKTESKSRAYHIIEFYILNKNKVISTAYFSKAVIRNKIIFDCDRLAWCYGDLGIGYILYQAGITFNDQKVIDFALEVLYHSTHRRTVEETQVFDAGICHGSAGVAHIYNRMWHYTKDPVFKALLTPYAKLVIVEST